MSMRVLAGHRLDGGGFEVVQLASRRHALGPLGGNVTPWMAPPVGDRIVSFTSAHDPAWKHAGGMQAIGHWLAVAMESGPLRQPAGFRTYDLANPSAPRLLTTSVHERISPFRAGAVAMTRLATRSGGPGRYLAMVFGSDSNDVEVFASSGLDMPGTAGSLSKWQSEAAALVPDTFEAYQNLQLITGCDQTLYVLGTHNNGVLPGIGEDWADLWRVEMTSEYKPTFTKVAKRHVYCSSRATGGVRYCNFEAGASGYVRGDGRLCVYGIEHRNDAFPGSGAAVKVREFCR